jgi:phospholipase C
LKSKLLSIVLSIFIIAIMLTSSFASHAGTATPIQHLVVLFQENESFDHYFGTYPNATNPSGEPQFQAAPDTPSVNGLNTALLTHNPNLFNPFRLDRNNQSQLVTCDMDHEYKDEQEAYDSGAMDKFVQILAGTSAPCNQNGSTVMGYYDGNTVTALWNYAQNFAMSDNFYESTFGPSTPGNINLGSGNTYKATADPGVVSAFGTIVSDADPAYDDCSHGQTIAITGGQTTNIGDLLSAAGITWGFFQGGFAPTTPYNPVTNTPAVCGSSHKNIVGATVPDYSAHHELFQYYVSTSNPHHLPPTSVSMIGQTDQANHQYDISDFWSAVQNGNMPAVSILKAAKYQDGHPGYSDPLDEQTFLVNTINALEKTQYWRNTAIIITWDDSDGWYDHVMPPIINDSHDPTYDALFGPTLLCGTNTPLGGIEDRCGYGPRIPIIVISPYSKVNFVDHSITDETSILRFIEYNWHLGSTGPYSFDTLAGSLLNMFDFDHGPKAHPLFLDPSTGEPT